MVTMKVKRVIRQAPLKEDVEYEIETPRFEPITLRRLRRDEINFEAMLTTIRAKIVLLEAQ